MSDMLRRPVISVVTACFNSETTIRACLESVAEQTYLSREHIIVDGLSTDSTCSIVEEFRGQWTSFVSESDLGLYSAWNKGIRRATGDYVLFLNSDDSFYDRSVLSDVAEFIVEQGYPRGVYGRLFAVEPGTGYSYVDGNTTVLADFLYSMKYCILAALVRRDVFDSVGLFREELKISSDYDWAIRFFKTGPIDIHFFDRIIIQFSVAGMSNTRSKLAHQEIDLIIAEHFPGPGYAKHWIYSRLLMIVKVMIPVARRTGILQLWRRLKIAVRK